ncbi:hypothetical protein IL332_16695 [Aeromonas caviae]|nr:hypothetical protein IL332_16695 [Aeromonas caviae]
MVNIVDPQIIAGETSDVTFTFSEKVTGFELGDSDRGGRHRDRADQLRWRQDLDRDLHPDPGLYRRGSVTVKDGSYTDLNGNVGTGGSDDTAIDTQAPSVVVNIVDPQIIAGETSDVTFTFSEKVTGFELGDLTVVGGTVTGLTSSDGGKTWTATFTPTPGYTGEASVTVKDGSYTDLNGNVGTGGSDDTAIDTQAPSVVVNIVDPQIIAGETSDVTFTFSEEGDRVRAGRPDRGGRHRDRADQLRWRQDLDRDLHPDPGYTGEASVTVKDGSLHRSQRQRGHWRQ